MAPPVDGDELATGMRFALRNGPRELRAVDTTCHITRIRTDTTALRDDSQPSATAFVLQPGDTLEVLCDPGVYIDPGHVRVLEATVAISVEYSRPDIDDRQRDHFVFTAGRGTDGRLVWRPGETTTGSANAPIR